MNRIVIALAAARWMFSTLRSRFPDPNRAAADPELAVLSAMAHGGGDVETAVKVGIAAKSGLSQVTDRDDYVP